ncbi:MAG: AraC family transcriptional regulator [Mesorhizobium sp.]|uniref:AraC family transcriptional regulator n=1 Tax=unclassified Mesorhizobium TaxID=325217 RepID=UPI000FE5C097|nr:MULTISPECIES: AraC family transcriptional regulator [unclassified Mesorhizobium]RWB26347.1 MAG: AraC family transcriptional regulator [Mesorhizobium sp.]RWB65249.1 MAG: AraC family transcriptional regulator [Mesorhizobium sp.]RWC21410.1 MAG: AraC family transcriptional regulator [Mesorhizobium sp.]RWD16333.1 MAG: AraC family transcriptional regulator [Mesorhizobium sp.]TGT92724.1 AraC family transcriptional regulator [Mesorhizobium sp. M5C.F.Ca.ET.164.01.1.1]
MNPTEKALWFVESHLPEAVSLDDVAKSSGVSRFHVTRAFGAATGHSVMGYVRSRRLTEAARKLAAGAPDILSVALDAGYASHEAFTRAFRDQFGTTPELMRAQGSLNNLDLVEPILMDQSILTTLEPPRFETSRPFLIAGLGERYSCETSAGIPMQWQRFGPYIGNIPGEIGDVAYGVCINGDDAGNFDYIAGVEVSDFSDLPREFSRARVPAQKYAVFAHRDHISTIRRTVNTIWNKWLPASGHEVADAPEFERYGPDFDPRSGNGGLEIWIPVKA